MCDEPIPRLYYEWQYRGPQKHSAAGRSPAEIKPEADSVQQNF